MKTTMKPMVLVAMALAFAACSAGAAPPTSPTPGVPSGPPRSAPRPSPGPSGSVVVIPPIETSQEAIAAVAAQNPEFLGYQPLDPDIIGASAWVEVSDDEDVFTLTFVKGSGDCPAGCIDRIYAKFEVQKQDGTVAKLCEWQEGSQAVGTPC